MKEKIDELNKSFSDSQPEEILGYFLNKHKNKIAFGSSLGAEDQVLTDMIAKIDKSAKIFTLDTGRLFPETYNLIEKTNKKYGINIDVYFPDKEMVEKMVKEKGINLFYESIENRKLCCHVRKVVPLHRALEGIEVWITGIRKDQTITRFFNSHVEWDDSSKIIKVNPLLNWTEKQVWEYIRKYEVPYNELHDKGFPSIGCQPCTRAVQPGEDIRGGRWWWEQPEHKECGLHNRNK
ncbi:MAG: phosphoadenylyl-sulfate reductase [Bacteroidales bacterium]|nr:phosphoadenylyl-sulfate reductase [Bacteroidales bacterium]